MDWGHCFYLDALGEGKNWQPHELNANLGFRLSHNNTTEIHGNHQVVRPQPFDGTSLAHLQTAPAGLGEIKSGCQTHGLGRSVLSAYSHSGSCPLPELAAEIEHDTEFSLSLKALRWCRKKHKPNV